MKYHSFSIIRNFKCEHNDHNNAVVCYYFCPILYIRKFKKLNNMLKTIGL